MVAPKRPNSLIRATISAGQTSSCSSFMTCGATSRCSHRSMLSSSWRASSESAATWKRGCGALIGSPSIAGARFELVAALHHEHGPVEFANHLLPLVAADRADADDALVGPRARFALREHGGFRVQRVAGEHGAGQ